MDHENALEAANEALSSPRSSSRIASVEFRGVDPLRRTGPALPSFDDRPSLSRELWQMVATITVAVVTLSLVVTLWML